MPAKYPTEYAGRGDPRRTMALLWGVPEGGRRRGPRPGLTVEQIVAAAVSIADECGLGGLSMRAVAERLGAGTMSLYRYVPGKAELLDVMVDRVSAETADGAEAGAPEEATGGSWRERLERVARQNRRLYERHPWLLWVYPGRPPLGPGTIAKYDRELLALEGIGLTDVEMDSVLTLVLDYARGAALSLVETARAPEQTGKTEEEWWHAFAPALEGVLEAGRFPLAERVGTAAGEAHQRAYYDPEGAFEFGLARLLDGVDAFLRQTQPRRVPDQPASSSSSRS